MVIGDKIPWVPVLRLHAPILAVVVFVSAAVAGAHGYLGFNLAIAPLPFSIVGVALSIFLAFRNNAAYDRYWEGRKLWGGLVNASRNFGRQATTLLTAGPGEAKELQLVSQQLVHRQIAYVNALRAALRGDDIAAAQAELLPERELQRIVALENPPVALLHEQARVLVAAAERGWLTDLRLLALDETLNELTNLQGGCERIKKTPIPLAYRFFSNRFVRAYCVLLPFALVEQLGLVTIAASVAVTFVFVVLDRIGDFLQDPFTTGFNGLPLSAICRTIEVDLRRQLGETTVPPLLTPENLRNGAGILR